MKYEFLPQSLVLQLTECIFFPIQVIPPPDGGGLSHSLVLVLVHKLFLRIHLPSGLHIPHAPLTSHNTFFYIFIQEFIVLINSWCLKVLNHQISKKTEV